MNWVWVIGGTWLTVGLALAVLIGRSIHLASVRAEHPDPEDVSPSAVVPLPASAPAIERRSPSIRRQNTSASAVAHSPLVGGCVSPTQRVPSEREHGVL